MGHCHEERDRGGQSWKEKIGSIIDQSNLPGLSVSSQITNSKTNTPPPALTPNILLVTQETGRGGAACLLFVSAEISVLDLLCREEQNGRELQRVFLSSPPLPFLQFFLAAGQIPERLHPTGLLTLREIVDINF